MSHAEKVLEVLKDKGPMRVRALAKVTKCAFVDQIVRKLRGEKKVEVEGKRNAIVHLPGQDVQNFKDAEDAPAGGGKAKKKGKKKKANGGRRAARRPVERNAEPAFIAAVTADTTLVLIGKGPEPLVFTVEQTEKIATLMFAQFKE